ncbi:hypothetical protein ALC53_06737 [Atta colombica]|uniref:Uncharacterized protein n=1 Tax=Atta colombica TaxID=520822 RepID=A0A151I396_9HYME|nr:hypothetical protein ALC53_06737 [Atta colombica]
MRIGLARLEYSRFAGIMTLSRDKEENSIALISSGKHVVFQAGCIFNILDKFNPGARQLINAGKAYLKALHAQKCAGDVECGQEGDSDPGVEEAARKRVQR